MAAPSAITTVPTGTAERLFMEHGNHFTKWKLLREDTLQATLQVVESMGLVGRELTVDQAELKRRFYEVPNGC